MPDQPDGGILGEPVDQPPLPSHRPAGRRPKAGTRRELTGGSRWRLSNWRLRTKVAAVLLVPTVTAIVLGGLRVQTELGNADNYRRTVSQVDAAREVTEVVHQLQKERSLVVARVAANNVPSNVPMQDQIQKTTAAITSLRAAVSGLDIPDTGSRARYDHAIEALNQLGALRTLAEGGVYPDTAVFTGYNSVIDNLVKLGREVAAAAADQGLSRTATAAETLDQAKEHIEQLNAILQIAAAHNAFRSERTQGLARSAQAAADGSISDFLALATIDERQSYSDGYSGPEVDRRQRIAQTALSSPDPAASLDIDVASLTTSSSIANDRLRKVETDLISTLRDQANTLADNAIAAAGRDSAIVAVALLAALGLMLVVAWSLLRPLRRLRLEALEIASTRLPEAVQRILADPDPVEAAQHAVEPVSVFSREEIGQLARSFDAVHEQAVRMATNQAVLRDNVNAIFVNLSRRSQLLVERQLSELDKLEQDEQDPDQLSRFFVLDHLATRMRRNSENLIILSGTGLAKHLSRPVPIGELVGAAVSEVEHYARVKLTPLPEVLVHGRAVKDLIHLIAELLDNATTFSAPETTVEVVARMMRARELAIQITDQGIGMTEEEIRTANLRLADPPDLDVAVSRRMGLYVVARLAQRHNIRVHLQSSEFIEDGTKAIIVVPSDLLVPLREQDRRFDDHTPSRTDLRAQTSGRTVKLWLDGEQPAEQSLPSGPEFRPDTEQRRTVLRGRQLLQQHDAQARQPEPEPEPPSREEPSAISGVDLFQSWSGEHDAAEHPAPPEHEPRARQADVEAPTTTRLPIYEEVLSQWFRTEEEPEEVEVEAERDPRPQPSAAAETALIEVQRPAPRPREEPGEQWHSPADEGWQAVQAKLSARPAAAPVTQAGLPKRVPKAQLVPGSAIAPAAEIAAQEANAPVLPPRSPDVIRGRLSSFQQGLGRGRRRELAARAEHASSTETHG
ncbi:sensor histidine kinase [Solihabitans fulvus]|uniref:sensor histidine kinase n=1 Tax=Solihabitans fulvus TaxID=1892852 RepID=UPI001661EFE2|nr:nitrate- and nitrite sensing domain-containing protein [Solihabitans fulvus]